MNLFDIFESNEQELDEDLRKWFKEKWVRFGPDGEIRGDCARGDDSEGKPKCLPQSKAQSLGKKGRASAAARKRREDPNPERSGKAINVNTKKKSNEGVAEGLDQLREAGKAIQSLQNLAVMKSTLTMQQLSQAGREAIVSNAINAAKTLEQSYLQNKQQGNAIFVRALRDEIDNFMRGSPINASFPETDTASELGDLLQGKLGKVNFQQGVAEAINPDITNPAFSHQQQIGDYLYVARYWSKGLKITAYHGNKKIGRADLMYHSGWDEPSENPKYGNPNKFWLESEMTEVHPKYQRQGIMGTMYAYARMLGNTIKASDLQSDEAQAAWKSWRQSGDKEHLTRMKAEAFGPLPNPKEDKPLKIQLGRHTVEIKRVGQDNDHISFAWHDSQNQDHYQEVQVGDLGSYDDLIDRIKQEISYQERKYTDQGVAEGSLNEFAPDGFNGSDDEGFSPEIAKMAQEDGFTKGAGLADGATLERAMTINHWHSQHGGMYKQYFAKGFKSGRMNKINHDNKQYNLNLKLMKDGSIRHGEQGVAEGSNAPYWRVEQSEATGRYYVVTGYTDKSRKVWKNKLGAADFNKKENAEAKANELNQGVVEGDDPWGPQGNFAGDKPVNVGDVTMKIIQVGDTVKYLGQRAKVVGMSKDRKYSRIAIESGFGGTTKDVLTADLKQLGQGVSEVSDSTKQSYKVKAQAQVKELEPYAKKGEYKDIAQRAIDRRQKGLAKVKDVAEEQLDEKCWDTHKQVGMKKKGNRMVPNCVPKESIEEMAGKTNPDAVRRIQQLLNKKFDANLDIDGILGPLTLKSIKKFLPKSAEKQAPNPEKTTAVQGSEVKEEKCPHCGGEMVSEELINEKKDSCYYKVKSRYKVWPSAYASGALVKCRKKGAKNWGNKSEDVAEGLNEMDKTQTPPGRDGNIDWTKKQIHLGPEHTMKAKDVAKHALKILNKTMKKSHADTPKKKGVAEDQLDEKWSQKYKDSINCSNPKGFSQKAHCAGEKKNEDMAEGKEYYTVTGTDSVSLRRDFNMTKDRNGWYLKEGATPKQKLEAFRAFGSPKLKEFNLAAFSGGTQTKGEDNVISPVGSQTRAQYKK